MVDFDYSDDIGMILCEFVCHTYKLDHNYYKSINIYVIYDSNGTVRFSFAVEHGSVFVSGTVIHLNDPQFMKMFVDACDLRMAATNRI